jgi:hypothetical protein
MCWIAVHLPPRDADCTIVSAYGAPDSGHRRPTAPGRQLPLGSSASWSDSRFRAFAIRVMGLDPALLHNSALSREAECWRAGVGS